ncbi:MAG TPA: YdcH family protein [Vulgatibacter sp.]|nr:YdcH family protein [Vulgatibacter sp.]
MRRQARVIDTTAKLEALRRRHAEFEERLRAFENRIYLTEQESTEVRRLKRLKLFAKDEMRRFDTAS